ncbi:hypothetical protein B7494_g1713 [Chlorociboria aeruginascens]|nr:hypothetical protein B7494_g1713 [Chlorociboria aeruginascens]
MASPSTALTTKAESGSPYQLNDEQASKDGSDNTKKDLLASTDDDDETISDETDPIFLTLTTKKHIATQSKFKPSKLAVPHSLNASPTSTICLITADPQRTYKDLIASPSFPASLSSRITRVVGVSKIKAKFSQYEAQRKLHAEHDIFLADDRIITRLPKLMGKVFYKSTTKRPIPINLQAPAPRSDGKRIARAKGAEKSVAEAKTVAAEIEKTIACAPIFLAASVNTSVKIGYADWAADKLAENLKVVVEGMVEKFVAKKWRGVRSIHIKGLTTAALPIWLASELWDDEGAVLDNEEVEAQKAIQANKANVGKKRKLIGGEVEKSEKKGKKPKLKESNDDNLDLEIKLRIESLKAQKEDAAKDGVDDVPKPTKRRDVIA